MQIEAAERGRVEDRLRQDHAIGHHHRRIGVVAAKGCESLLGLQRLRGVPVASVPSTLPVLLIAQMFGQLCLQGLLHQLLAKPLEYPALPK